MSTNSIRVALLTCVLGGAPLTVSAQEDFTTAPVVPIGGTAAAGDAEFDDLAPAEAPPPSFPVADEVRIEVEVDEPSSADDAAPDAEPALPPEEELPAPPQAIFLHGFRLGYLYIFDTDGPIDPRDPASRIYEQRYDMRSPHLFMLGYELTWRMIGYDWLNLLLIGNVLIAGLEQSRFFPSANLMLGFEIARMVQVGVGVSVTPTKEEPAHMVLAAGWTPRIGSFYIPVHAFFVPDINGHHKLGVTVGINFF